MSQVYGIHDLTDLNWYGDNRMLDFLSQWDFIIDHMEEDISMRAWRDLLYRQMDKATALADDMARFKRVGTLHPDKSCEFLRDAIERHINNTHRTEDCGRAASQLPAGPPAGP